MAQQSVFGYGSARMKSLDFNPSAQIGLTYSIVIPSWGQAELIEHKSILNAKVNFIQVAGDHAEFQLIVNIFKHNNPNDAMKAILAWNHDTVNLMLHIGEGQDGKYIKAEGGGDAAFFITAMQPFYMRTEPPVLEDRLSIKFKSLDAVDAINTVW